MNKRYVITGGPCCGKTTLINELQGRGFSVLEEVARKVIEERKHIPADREEWEIREELIFRRQLERERQTSGDLIFLDRGLPDGLAYSKHFLGYLPERFDQIQLSDRYSGVFILDLLPFEHDGLRIESGEKEARDIHDKIVLEYVRQGYSPIYVPVMSGAKKEAVKQRAEYVLGRIDGL